MIVTTKVVRERPGVGGDAWFRVTLVREEGDGGEIVSVVGETPAWSARRSWLATPVQGARVDHGVASRVYGDLDVDCTFLAGAGTVVIDLFDAVSTTKVTGDELATLISVDGDDYPLSAYCANDPFDRRGPAGGVTSQGLVQRLFPDKGDDAEVLADAVAQGQNIMDLSIAGPQGAQGPQGVAGGGDLAPPVVITQPTAGEGALLKLDHEDGDAAQAITAFVTRGDGGVFGTNFTQQTTPGGVGLGAFQSYGSYEVGTVGVETRQTALLSAARVGGVAADAGVVVSSTEDGGDYAASAGVFAEVPGGQAGLYAEARVNGDVASFFQGVLSTGIPSAPATGFVLYAMLDTGKTTLYVRFPTGAAQVIAVEP